METRNSGANHAVLHAQINRRSLGHIEPCNSEAHEMRVGTHRDLQFWC